MTKKILASVLACAMAVSTASVAFAADEDTPAKGVATGDGFGSGVEADVTTQAKDAILQFQVPTTMTVALDPFQAGDTTGSQVYSLDEAIWNKSNIAIRVTVKAGLVVGKDAANGNAPLAVVHEDPSEVDSTDPSNTDKDAYVELVAQKPTATTDRSGAVVVTPVLADGATFQTEYTEEGADTTAKIILKENDGSADLESEISFALQAATYTADRSGQLAFSAMAENDKGVGTFRFMGSLNANADSWSGEDLKVRVVYDVNGLGSAAYDAMFGENGSVTDAQLKAANVYSTGAAVASDPSVADSSDGSVSFAAPNTNGTDVEIVINKGSWDAVNVTGVTFTDDDTNSSAVALTEGASDDFEWDNTTNTLTIKGGTTSKGVARIGTSASEATYTISIENSDGSSTTTLTHKINVTQ